MTLKGQGHDLERSRSYVELNGTIRFLDLKHTDLDTQNVILSAVVQKLWSKTYFCKMVADVTHSGTSHIQTTILLFLIYLKAFTQATLC